MGRRVGRLLIYGSVLAMCAFASLPFMSQIPSAVAQEEAKSLSDDKTRLEIEKLRLERNQLEERSRWEGTPVGWFATYVGSLASTALTVVVGFLGIFIPWRLNAARIQMMAQEKELAREEHNIELFRGLASPRPRLQLAAAAALLQRIFVQPSNMDNGSLEAKERKTIVDVLVAVTKEKPRPSAGTSTAKPEVSELPKYIGDNIVKALHAVMKAKPASHSKSPLAHAGTDWQKVQLVEVWWEGVDARGIDFFQANFERAGLAGAHLHKTVFYQASLRGAVLRNADLREANLEEADLSGVESERRRFDRSEASRCKARRH